MWPLSSSNGWLERIGSADSPSKGDSTWNSSNWVAALINYEGEKKNKRGGRVGFELAWRSVELTAALAEALAPATLLTRESEERVGCL